MLIMFVVVYLVLQLGAAICVRRFAERIRYKQLLVLLLLFGVFAWTHWVDMAWVYKHAPLKYGVIFYNPTPLSVALMLALLSSVSKTKSVPRHAFYFLFALGVNAYFF